MDSPNVISKFKHRLSKYANRQEINPIIKSSECILSQNQSKSHRCLPRPTLNHFQSYLIILLCVISQ